MGAKGPHSYPKSHYKITHNPGTKTTMQSSKVEYLDYRLYVFHETEKAWLVGEELNRDKAFWIPKSQCVMEETGLTKGTLPINDFEIPFWLATEKGLT